jgi:CheY-like chemotaxis protein
LIEDNPDGRETLQLLLESWGHQVEVAEDGLEGLSKALAWKPDAAVVDIGLPLLDGYSFARRVRAALSDNILLIALTAYSQPEDRRQALQAGFDVHMSKPADFVELGRVLGQPMPSRERS